MKYLYVFLASLKAKLIYRTNIVLEYGLTILQVGVSIFVWEAFKKSISNKISVVSSFGNCSNLSLKMIFPLFKIITLSANCSISLM